MDKEQLYETAVQEFDNGETDSAIEKLMISAKLGCVHAMEMLAILYGDGNGVDADFDRSVYWDIKAIEAGSKTSLSNLAISYRTSGNIREAKKWFEKAVVVGDGDAALDLAKLYMVSDKERQKIVELLQKVIHSDNVCGDSIDEARAYLKEYS